MSEEKLDLILANQELIMADIAAVSGGAAPPDTSGEAWIGDEGRRRRNPESPKWNSDLWDLHKIDSIRQVDISGIPQHKGEVTGTYVTRYGHYSYDIMVMPNIDFGIYHRATGQSITRLLVKRSGVYVVEKVARLHQSLVYRAGTVRGDILILQVSNRKNCGVVFTNDV